MHPPHQPNSAQVPTTWAIRTTTKKGVMVIWVGSWTNKLSREFHHGRYVPNQCIGKESFGLRYCNPTHVPRSFQIIYSSTLHPWTLWIGLYEVSITRNICEHGSKRVLLPTSVDKSVGVFYPIIAAKPTANPKKFDFIPRPDGYGITRVSSSEGMARFEKAVLH